MRLTLKEQQKCTLLSCFDWTPEIPLPAVCGETKPLPGTFSICHEVEENLTTGAAEHAFFLIIPNYANIHIFFWNQQHNTSLRIVNEEKWALPFLEVQGLQVKNEILA